MKPWHTLTIDETRAAIASVTHDFQPNRIEDLGKNAWYYLLARQFTNILVIVLLIATILSFILGDTLDAIAILGIITFNGIVGFVQEWKAESAIRNLKKMLAPRCRVIRNGIEQKIDAVNLVPGDCVLLKVGDVVPADIRLSEAINLMLDESALTGESSPTDKITDSLLEETMLSARRNMAYMGTHIVNGYGKGIVVATGMATEFGQIARLTGEIDDTKSRLQNELSTLSKQIGLFALVISAAVTIIGIIDGKNIIDMVMTGIALAVSAIPEGLPAVVTVSLALGAIAMTRKHALMRRLDAAETLGAVSVICTDKTGTLTRNEMVVQQIWLPGVAFDITGTGYEPTGSYQVDGKKINPESYPDLLACLETAHKCNHANIIKGENGWLGKGSPDEAALKVAALKAGFVQEEKHNFVIEFSFNSTRKRMSVVEQVEHQKIVHAKGAPEVMIDRCAYILEDGEKKELSDELRQRMIRAYQDMAETGLRTLVLARKEIESEVQLTEEHAENQLIFLGIVGIYDPPRPEVYEAISHATSAGIKVVMITGDSPVTAKSIANQIGMHVETVVTSSDIKKIDDAALIKLLRRDVLFARTVPDDKLRIVRLLQADNQLVAMTGDGVNDAPALKQADVGVAMGIRGTDVARSVADIVLSDDNFASIVAAIREGRRQYANIRKCVLYLASSNIGEVLAILINILMGGALILLPLQILWINLVTDSATAITLGVEAEEKNSMKFPPRRINISIINRHSLLMLLLFGSYIGIATFIIYMMYLKQSYNYANTIAFTAVVLMSNLHALNFRHLHGVIGEVGWFTNKWLLFAIAGMFMMQVAAIYLPALQNVLHTVPIAATDWLVIICISLPLFLIPEIYKWWKYKS